MHSAAFTFGKILRHCSVLVIITQIRVDRPVSNLTPSGDNLCIQEDATLARKRPKKDVSA